MSFVSGANQNSGPEIQVCAPLSCNGTQNVRAGPAAPARTLHTWLKCVQIVILITIVLIIGLTLLKVNSICDSLCGAHPPLGWT